nr:hypothetical protein [uncultured Bdellovibrio sp.]
MDKVKEKVAFVLSLVSVGLVRTSEVKGVVSSDEPAKKVSVETKYDVVKSFIRSTDGQAARNTALT